MELINTYVEAEDFDKSINFYKQILQMEPYTFCEDRWVEFDTGNTIALYNKKYDEEKIKNNNNNYNQAYIDDFYKPKFERRNNVVTFNFYTEDLKGEYSRIKDLKIGEVSEIMYVNIVEPYYYFTIKDPDGNVLEICSDKYE